jgi:uncharacterized hydrophobic protein (TIGR00341 family)
MRQLLVQVPEHRGAKALEIASRYDAVNSVRVQAVGTDGPADLVILHVSNNKVGPLIDDLGQIPDLKVTLIPRGVLVFQPPAEEAPEQVIDVQLRSPIEIFLAGLQSIGSWKGFLGYAAAAGVVVWIGLYTNTIFLLVAAMLIAPFAGPAMNAALATARGDWVLLRQSVLRYFSALGVAIFVAWLLSILLRQEVPTPEMVERSQISEVAVLLPLVAGAAGALHLVQSERSSLVPGAAVGMLVAASLSPPAGLVGMASAIGQWDMALSGLFVLFLQLAGINLTGSLVFRLSGLSPEGSRYDRGKPWLSRLSLALTTAALAALLTLQFWTSPDLRRPSQAQRAAAEVQNVVDQSDHARLVETSVRFTRADIPDQNTLLIVTYVQPTEGTDRSPEQIRTELTSTIQTHLLHQGYNVTPLVDIIVLAPPTRESAAD